MPFNFQKPANTPANSGLNFSRPAYRKPAPDPLQDVNYTGNLAQDAATELSAMQQAYRQRNQREQDRFTHATDSEYWVAFCFPTRADKEHFLQTHGLTPLGDKYIDGNQAAKIINNSNQPHK